MAIKCLMSWLFTVCMLLSYHAPDSHVLQDLLPLLPGAIAGEIESKAANLNNLVVEAYKVCCTVYKFFYKSAFTTIFFRQDTKQYCCILQGVTERMKD